MGDSIQKRPFPFQLQMQLQRLKCKFAQLINNQNTVSLCIIGKCTASCIKVQKAVRSASTNNQCPQSQIIHQLIQSPEATKRDLLGENRDAPISYMAYNDVTKKFGKIYLYNFTNILF